MSAEWTSSQRPAQQIEYQYKATVNGLELRVSDRDGWVSWTVTGALDDFHLFASGRYVQVTETKRASAVEEAKAKAITAAHRLLELGARGPS